MGTYKLQADVFLAFVTPVIAEIFAFKNARYLWHTLYLRTYAHFGTQIVHICQYGEQIIKCNPAIYFLRGTVARAGVVGYHD